MAKLDAFLKLMNQEGASDLHLAAGSPPLLRIHGELQKIKYNAFDNDTLSQLIFETAPKEKVDTFLETGDVDFGYEIQGLARYRVNFFKQKYGVGAVYREIPQNILTVDQLGLPPVISKLALLSQGLVLVTGATGSGKSTTLAAIIDHANKNRMDHIVTIEDPIEFVHRNQKCHVNHREVGTHTESFSSALRGALREDPDIIMVGELRDLETMELALEAAATGHLVFGTLHTQSATKTIDRIIDVFPANQQSKIRTTLSEALRAVVSQTLFKRQDKKGRVGAYEILVINNALSNLIREGKTFQMATFIQTGKKHGMQSLDDDILRLLQQKVISPEEAYTKAVEKEKFAKFLTNVPDIFV